MWTLLEFVPNLYELLKDLARQKKYHAILFILYPIVVGLVLYYGFYTSVFLIALLILFICQMLLLVLSLPKTQMHTPIKLTAKLSSHQQKIAINYRQLFDDNSYKISMNDTQLTLVLTAVGGYLLYDSRKIPSAKLSPIFDYGVLFKQLLKDKHGDVFVITARFGGVIRTYLCIEIARRVL